MISLVVLGAVRDKMTAAVPVPTVDQLRAALAEVLAGYPDPLPAAVLTGRELTVLRGIADGLSYRQIGAQLYLAPETVKKGAQVMFTKLGVRDRVSAVVAGFRLGILKKGVTE